MLRLVRSQRVLAVALNVLKRDATSVATTPNASGKRKPKAAEAMASGVQASIVVEKSKLIAAPASMADKQKPPLPDQEAPVVLCDCGKPAVLKTCGPSARNPGLRYYTCEHSVPWYMAKKVQAVEPNCKFFSWVDVPEPKEPKPKKSKKVVTTDSEVDGKAKVKTTKSKKAAAAKVVTTDSEVDDLEGKAKVKTTKSKKAGAAKVDPPSDVEGEAVMASKKGAKRGSRSSKAEDEAEKPKKGSRSSKAEDEAEKPKKKGSRSSKAEDGAEKPKMGPRSRR